MIAALTLATSLAGLSSLASLTPDHARVQTGGFVGMVTVGLGYAMANEHLTVDGTYGWVPPRHGAPSAHLGTLTLGARPKALRLSTRVFWVPCYAGLGVFVGHNAKERPAAVEDSPLVWWGLFALGTELALHQPDGAPIIRHALFVEEVTLGPYLYSVVTNGGAGLQSSFSTALGYRASF